MSDIIKAINEGLTNARKAIKDLPPAPMFDEAGNKAALAGLVKLGSLTQTQADSFLKTARNKFDDENGDQSAAQVATLEALAPAFGGIDGVAKLARQMALSAAEEGKVKLTPKEITLAMEGKGDDDKRKLVERAVALRRTGKPITVIVEELNLTSQATQYLSLAFSPKQHNIQPASKAA